LEAIERSQDLDRALGALDFEHRQAVVLFYLDGLTLAAIAHAMGVPEGTVKSRLHQAKAQLRRIMERSS
jgi:RNA polymerase sigma-70 factor (ECF subfamily)